MSRYIDAEKIQYQYLPLAVLPHRFATEKQISEIPTADVEPVRHGYWIPSPDGINPIRCSECNMPAPFAAGENEFGDFEICRYPSSYCHECGAKMDGEDKQ